MYLDSDINPCVYGSFVRQYLEMPFMPDLDLNMSSGYGNCIGRDIDIMMYNKFFNYNNYIMHEELYDFINEELNMIIEYPTFFGKYKLNSFKDATIRNVNTTDSLGKTRLLLIPHYKLEFINLYDETLEVDLFGWRPSNGEYFSNDDFNVNCIYLNKNGICCNENDDMLDILGHIRKKQAKQLLDVQRLEQLSIENPLIRESLYKQIIYFLSERIKILNMGYDIISNNLFPNITIERDEDCIITCCQAPYINFELQCGHKISIISLAGLITQNEYSYNLCCPICRADVRFKYKSGIILEQQLNNINSFETKKELKNLLLKDNNYIDDEYNSY